MIDLSGYTSLQSPYATTTALTIIQQGNAENIEILRDVAKEKKSIHQKQFGSGWVQGHFE